MEIIPTVNPKLIETAKDRKSTSFQPEISYRGSQKTGSNTSHSSVHDRLYADAVEDQHSKHNLLAEMVKDKLNVTLAPWEHERDQLNKNSSWTGHKNHTQKSHFSPIFEQIIIPYGDHPTVALVEYDDQVNPIWKALRAAAIPKEQGPLVM